MLLKASFIAVLSLHRLCVAHYAIGWVGLKLIRVVIHCRVRLAVGMYKRKKVINARKQVHVYIILCEAHRYVCMYVCITMYSVHGHYKQS